MNDSERLRRQRLVYYAEDIDQINRIIDKLLELSQAKYVLMVDTEGHMITKRGTTPAAIDEETVSALVAGSFAATKEMARLLGEEEFSVLFHQGERDSIQLTLVGNRVLLAIVFDDHTTIGMVRLYAQQTAKKLAALFDRAAERRESADQPAEAIAGNFGDSAKEKMADFFKE
jgi:predicted regulator of Ras-like GTPase activity (Roadblock/LC7/MglB family)